MKIQVSLKTLFDSEKIPVSAKFSKVLLRLRYHLLWNVIPTLLMLALTGWISLIIGERIDAARQSNHASAVVSSPRSHGLPANYSPGPIPD